MSDFNNFFVKYNTALVCFFFSGFAGLIYEVCWIRKASLVFGSTTFAASSVLAVFFLGLSIGSYLFGLVAQRTNRPLFLYAILEVGLGVLALVSTYAFDIVNVLYGITYRALAGNTGFLFLFRIVLISIILLPPTILMGGTMPLFCRQLVVSENKIARSVGLLYGINTMGAVFGAVAAGYTLIPQFGLYKAILFGVAINFIIGIIVFSMRMTYEPVSNGQIERKVLIPDRRSVIIAMLFFLSGFVALGNEILWIRYLSLFVRNSVYTYTLTLTVVLIGIVVGSFLASGFIDLSNHREFYFGILQILTGLLTLTIMMLPLGVDKSKDYIWIYFLLLLVPSVLSGACFPLAIRMVVDNPLLAGIGVGRMSAINMFGGIFGALSIGFIGLPLFGMKVSLLLTTGLSLCIGFAAWWLLDSSGSRVHRNWRIVYVIAIWLLIPRATDTRLPADFLGSREDLVDFHEGFTSNLSIVRYHCHYKNVYKEYIKLLIDQLWQGQEEKNHQIMVAHIPILLHPDPRSVLVVGAGTGMTAGRFLMYDIDRLDCVDIEPKVFELIQEHFDSTWMEDDRVRLINEDGRSYITHTDAKYDIISIEVGQLFRPGVSSFYTGEFYQLVKKRLNPNGLIIQFTPLRFFTAGEFRSILRTFLDEFPNSFLWYNTSECLLIGKNGVQLEIDTKRLNLMSTNNRVNQDMRYSYCGCEKLWLNQPQVFLAGYLLGPRGLAALSDGASVYSDDRPVLEYLMSNDMPTLADRNEIADLLRKYLDPVKDILTSEITDVDIAVTNKIRKENLDSLFVNRHLSKIL